MTSTRIFFLGLAVYLALSSSTVVLAQSSTNADVADPSLSQPHEVYERALVTKVVNGTMEEIDGMSRLPQEVTLKITNGEDKGTSFAMENGVLNNRADMILKAGETVVIRKLDKSDGTSEYVVQEKYRLPNMAFLGLFFVALSVLFGGLTGISSILGLLASIGILMFFVLPKIVAGADPLTVSLIGAFLIACTSLYLAHGFNRRTSLALLSTLLTLVISAVFAIVFVHVAKIFGLGSEESMYLQMGQLQNVNLRGLLLGGIIIGCLGVLDDITTAQTAAIHEIYKANPSLSFSELRKAGFSVGREHIASLINTLALAYVGASLPLLLLFQTGDQVPLWSIANSEFIAEEVIRTLVGSSTLIIAVPISTWIAAYFFSVRKMKTDPNAHGHSHAHSHGAWN